MQVGKIHALSTGDLSWILSKGKKRAETQYQDWYDALIETLIVFGALLALLWTGRLLWLVFSVI